MASGGINTEPPVESPLLWTRNEVDKLVKVPSVFSDTGWVEWRLFPSEILRLLDVPKILDKAIF